MVLDKEFEETIQKREYAIQQAKQFGRKRLEHYMELQNIDPIHVAELIANRDCDDVYKKDEILVNQCKKGIEEKKERGT